MKKIFLILLILHSSIFTLHSQRIMTLQECVREARINNVKAKDSRNDLLIAKEQQRYARTKYFPMVGASASHFEASDYLLKQKLFSPELQDIVDLLSEGSDLFDNGAINAIKRGTSMGLTVLEPLFVGGRISNFNKLADMQVDARQKLQQVVDDEIVMTTEFLFYKILELHETDKMLDAMEKETESIHRDAVNIYENGIVNKNDVLNVELTQDQLSALRIKTANACRLLRRALAKYMGMADQDIDIEATFSDDEIVDPQVYLMPHLTALENRTETQLLDIWVDKSVLEKKIARANLQPILLLGGSASYSKLLSEWSARAIAFATIQIPISAHWSERRMYKWKKIEVEKAKDFRQDKRELISLQIQDAWDNLESTYRQTQIAKKSVDRSAENLRINREHYLNGMTTMTALLDAQRQWQQSLTARNAAISEYLQAKTRYLILTGRRDDVKP
jgi:outer membrane protein TolC